MLISTLLAGLAMAQVTPLGISRANRDQLWYDQALFARVNPLGLIDTFRIGYRRRLEVSDNALGRDAYVFTGASLIASPAFLRAGAFIDVEPVALFRASATYQYSVHFGSFDQVASFPGPNVDASDSALAALGDAGGTAPTGGHIVTLMAQPKFAIGPMAFRNTLTAVWTDMLLPAGDTAWYEQTYDRLAPDGGWMLVNDADVMGIVNKARVGVRYTYSNSYFAPDEPGDGAIPHHRIGPLFAWQFHNHKDRARFDRPTLFVLAQWWLQHPYRTGADTPVALPLIALGLAFEGDLLWKGPPGGKKAKTGKRKR